MFVYLGLREFASLVWWSITGPKPKRSTKICPFCLRHMEGR